MKLSPRLRRFTRTSMGMGRATPIAAKALHDLAASERVVVIGVGMVRDGAIDPRLPGEARAASLLTLSSVVADLPRAQPIALHCG